MVGGKKVFHVAYPDTPGLLRTATGKDCLITDTEMMPIQARIGLFRTWRCVLACQRPIYILRHGCGDTAHIAHGGEGQAIAVHHATTGSLAGCTTRKPHAT